MIKKIVSIFTIALTLSVVGQKKSFSPYSVVGIGDKYQSKTVEQASMGGIGVACQNYKSLNFVNPAALSKIRVATYGFATKSTFQELQASSQKLNSSSLSYIALGFPIGKKAGMSLGLQPMSSVEYSVLNKNLDASGDITSSTRLKGSGGTNSFFLSFGVDVYKGLSLGLQTSYVFGNIEKSILNTPVNGLLSTKYAQDSHISGAQFKIGAYYQTNLSSSLQLSSGVAVQLESDLSGKGNERMYTLSFNGVEEIVDDVLFVREPSSNGKEPMSVVLGAGLGLKNSWYVGLNSALTNKNKNRLNQNNINFENSFTTSLGGYYIPKKNSITSYWKRVTYRGGLRYEKTGLMVKAPNSSNFSSLNDFGINLGLSLPLPKQVSAVSLGFEYGIKGAANDNSNKENYYNLRLGLSLNSLKWFRKREID